MLKHKRLIVPSLIIILAVFVVAWLALNDKKSAVSRAVADTSGRKRVSGIQTNNSSVPFLFSLMQWHAQISIEHLRARIVLVLWCPINQGWLTPSPFLFSLPSKAPLACSH